MQAPVVMSPSRELFSPRNFSFFIAMKYELFWFRNIFISMKCLLRTKTNNSEMRYACHPDVNHKEKRSYIFEFKNWTR